MSSQLATWQHVTTQFKCDVTNRTCLNTIDANMCGAFKTNILNLSNTQSTFHTRAQNKNDRTKTPNDKQTHHNQHRQIQHIMTNGTLPHNNVDVQLVARRATQYGTTTEKVMWETMQTHENDDGHL